MDGLGRADGKAFGMNLEHLLDGPGFDWIVQWSCRAMRIDIVDV
jgi:hypothetical protein